ncbi:MAG: PQQ-binding-like beta-propeller repeat protein, partial [Pirellulaceae bacterium]|nr:PQQ-binding-like beta-propeller repeat protein [Pirellulaceae bacterium]
STIGPSSSDAPSPNQAVGSESAQTPYAPSGQPGIVRATKPFPVLSALIGVSIGAAVMVMAQWFAPTFDHQNANMISIAAGILTLLYLVVLAHRSVASHGYRWRVPGVVVAAICSFLLLVRMDGFSGEMVPQLKWRFGSGVRPELKEIPTSGPTGVAVADDIDAKQAAADWPQFLGVNRTGVINERLFAVPNGIDDARVLWDQGIGEGWSSFAVVNDRAVTLEQRDDQECVTCYRLIDGELLWIVEHEARHENPMGGIGPRSTPTIAESRVYTNGATGLLQCIDVQSGDVIWSVDLLELADWNQLESEAAAPWGRATSPLLIESLGLCVVGFGSPVQASSVGADGMTDTLKSLIALDARTGEVKWKAGRDQFSYASPILMKLAGRDQIVSVNEKTVSGHEPETGEQLWSFSWPGATNAGATCSMAIPAGDDSLIVGKGYGGGSRMMKIVQRDGKMIAEEVWSSSRILKTKFNHALVQGDVAYGISNGSLQAARISTAQPLWTQPRRSRFGQGQVILVDDVLVAQSEDGDVVFVSADETEYRELGRLPALQSKTWNIPTIAGRHLLVRNDRRAICYLLEAK